ncbi:MAG: hypothetical protein KME17_04680 [Cyanosarcina radialis HA8281-LM2]|jgi:ABC-type uncharacterized transport system substrate-binding protein|nr:hypothetical protein [Cyanosarcina radialis HA8281-LM2]
MTTYVFRSLKGIAKRLTALLIMLVMLLGFTPTAAIAVSSHPETFISADDTKFVSDEKANEMKEQRREWQSRVSSSHDARNDKSNSSGKTPKEKLNLDEITDNHTPER